MYTLTYNYCAQMRVLLYSVNVMSLYSITVCVRLASSNLIVRTSHKGDDIGIV